MRPRWMLLSIPTLVILIAALLAGCPKGQKKDAAATAEVAATSVLVVRAGTGDIYQTETLTGTIEPQREVDVQTELSGKVAWVGYDVGDRVSRGQALVRLDTALAASGERQSEAAVSAARARYGQTRVGLKLTREQTASQVRQAESSMEGARNRLRQAKTTAELTRSRVEDAIRQARIGVDSAHAQLADVKAGTRSQEVDQAQARLEQAKSSSRLAKLSLDRARNLMQQGAVAQAQLDSAQVEYETAQANVRVAEQALDLAKEGARSQQIRVAELLVQHAQQVLAQAEAQRGQTDVAERDVRTAEVALEQAEESARLARAELARVSSTEQDVRAARAAVQQASAANVYSRTQVSKHTIYAPISGTIAQRNVEPGEGASPGVSLVRIVNLNPVRVTCEASELQVRDMQVGQQGKVLVDALPGRSFVGRITDIAPQTRNGDRIFLVRLQVPNEGALLRAGMFARVQIVTGLHRNTVVVPRDVLLERGEKRVIYTVVGDKVKVRDVEIGAADDGRIEVLRGVRAGDVMVFGGQSLLAEGQKIRPQLRDEATAATQKAETTAEGASPAVAQ